MISRLLRTANLTQLILKHKAFHLQNYQLNQLAMKNVFQFSENKGNKPSKDQKYEDDHIDVEMKPIDETKKAENKEEDV